MNKNRSVFKNSPHGHKSHILVTHRTRAVVNEWSLNVFFLTGDILLGGVRLNQSSELNALLLVSQWEGELV